MFVTKLSLQIILLHHYKKWSDIWTADLSRDIDVIILVSKSWILHFIILKLYDIIKLFSPYSDCQSLRILNHNNSKIPCMLARLWLEIVCLTLPVIFQSRYSFFNKSVVERISFFDLNIWIKLICLSQCLKYLLTSRV